MAMQTFSEPRAVVAVAAASPARARDVVFIHSDAYFRALSHLPVHPRREQMTLALLIALSAEHTELDPQTSHKRPFGMQFITPTPATADQLLRFHARDYVDTLHRTAQNESCKDAISLGDGSRGNATRHRRPVSDTDCEEFELVDDAYVFPGLYEYCRMVAGASLTAANALKHLVGKWRQEKSEGRVEPAPVAINLGGGRHHAMRSQASGFCYVNDVVLAIQCLLSPTASDQARLERVLCVDIDVHHGDGVQEAFLFSPNVTTVSFHLFERAFFPGTGAQDEVGMGHGKNHNVNVPLRRGIVDAQFHSLFEAVMNKAIECIDPDVIVLVCGVDTLARDTLGGFNLTSCGVTDCVRTLTSFDCPLLMFGGGGYSGADACRALAAVVSTVVAPDLDLQGLHVPEQDFYEEYGPDFRMATKPVIHRPNENTDEALKVVRATAIEVLEKAKAARLARGGKREHSGRKRSRCCR